MDKKYLKSVSIVILVMLFIGIAAILIAKSIEKNNYRRIVKIDGQCELQDKSGKIIIPPYNQMRKTSYDLFVVIKDDKLGLIDKNGRILINPQYVTNTPDYYFRFSDGLAAIIKKAKSGKHNCVYVDKTGREVLDPTRFGRSTVQNENFVVCSDFSDGLAAVKGGYINKKGELVIKLDDVLSQGCDDALCHFGFSHGIATVSVNNKTKYIDKLGKFIEKPKYDYVGEFSQGLAPVCGNSDNYKDNKCGFVDKNGKVIIEQKFGMAMAFSEGFAPFQNDNKWGYIDKNGKTVIKPQFDFEGEFSEGLAPVLYDSNWGYINKRGKIVITPQFGVANGFSDGEAYVRLDSKCYYINKKGIKLYETCCEPEY